MYTLDGSIVNIAVPTLLRVFQTDVVTVQWVIIGYLLVIICGLLAIARLAEWWGQKRIFIIGLGLFTLGSLLCGLSPNIYSLIAFRIVQGFGAVCMAALMSATVISLFPAHQLGQALGIVTTAATLGTSLGPSLGGLFNCDLELASHFSGEFTPRAICYFFSEQNVTPSTRIKTLPFKV